MVTMDERGFRLGASWESELGDWHRRIQKTQREIGRRLLGKRAPKRKRRRRVAKKIAARGGAMHYGCLADTLSRLSGIMAKADRWTT